jgi:hypothetical protein
MASSGSTLGSAIHIEVVSIWPVGGLLGGLAFRHDAVCRCTEKRNLNQLSLYDRWT